MEVESLKFTLRRLQEIKEKRNRIQDKQSSGNRNGAVWMEACGRQLEQRLRAERENLQLKKKCKREERIVKQLKMLLYKRPSRWETAYPETRNGFLTRRIEIPEGYMNQTAALIFDKLSASVKNC
ncbi:hypothetical protein P3T76_008224 [Phytophthora citrophthora]|uniref:Uncharacterized protein n=1 Tax=Phytophthora citrophthora TaxID=4793 RepID=A0AAD9GKV9_9STRA|nr:hypothetical protein P3T76_008224 [Phytophthora citrophthora]